jgi:hypothetical protein
MFDKADTNRALKRYFARSCAMWLLRYVGAALNKASGCMLRMILSYGHFCCGGWRLQHCKQWRICCPQGGRVAVTQCVGAAPKGGAQLAKGSCAATYLRRRHAPLADDKDKPS